MQESKGVWWAKLYTSDGTEHSFTLRQEDGQSDAEFLERVMGFQDLLYGLGYISRSELAGLLPQLPPPQQANGNGGQQAQGGDEKSFAVESIVLASGGEHPRWVVKGGNFLKYGVTCWPETLEAAAIPVSKLDAVGVNTPKIPLMAVYVEKANDEGKLVPDKVVRLERA